MAIFNNYDAIELDYRAGVLPLSAICAKHQISRTKLDYIAEKHHWDRNKTGTVKVPLLQYPHELDDIHRVYSEQGPIQASIKYDIPMQSLLTIAEEDGWVKLDTPDTTPVEFPLDGKGVRSVSMFNKEDIDRATLIASTAIVYSHRKSIERMRRLANKSIGGMEQVADGQIPDFNVIGDRESFLDALGKLTIIMEKLIKVERDIYGIVNESTAVDPNDKNSRMDTEERRKKIAELMEKTNRVRLITEESNEQCTTP